MALGVVVAWAIGAYLAMPEYWKHYFRKHPSLADLPGVTHTGGGIPADPLNSALIGTKAEVIRALLAARWYPADPLSLKSSLEIAEASVLRRPYVDAPVSSLYLFGRKEDLAFEQPVGDNPRQRHHVRFWLTEKLDGDGRPLWIGAAVYDDRVGLSHRTGAVTHHTAADVDAERNKLFNDLATGGQIIEQYSEDNFHEVREGKNGGGDPWRTDGRLFVGVTKPDSSQGN
ncbi:MAG: LssY C-terminal domain-containing protein [Planctomycetaceae bacterium]|nr:LssY C-terminal domain-containing protein [Planctomycetaceae bacterium]